MNSVILIGRPTRDPEIKTTSNGGAMAAFTLAVDRSSKDDGADFPRIKCFGKSAEIVEKYVTKGKAIAVQGRISTSSYQDKEGKTIYATDVIADRVELLGKADKQEADAKSGRVEAWSESDIPF